MPPQELVTEAPNISEDAVQLMKFHGSYMQDNREERTFGAGKAYQVGAWQRVGAAASGCRCKISHRAAAVNLLAPPCGRGTWKRHGRAAAEVSLVCAEPWWPPCPPSSATVHDAHAAARRRRDQPAVPGDG